MGDGMFKDWESQIFWSGLTALFIPALIYLIGAYRDRRLFYATLGKIDPAPYLLYFSFYYDFLEKFARGADQPVTSLTTISSFQNISTHLLSTIASMKTDIAEAAKYAYGIKLIGIESKLENELDQLVSRLEVLHKILRTHEVSIIGRAAVFPSEEPYKPLEIGEITFEQVTYPVERIIELLRAKSGFHRRADEHQAALIEYSKPMNMNILQQGRGYEQLLRWIRDNALIPEAKTPQHA